MSKFFYIPKNIARKIIKEAEAVCFDKFCDELDCSKSFHRGSSEKTVDEILDLCESGRGHYVVVERRHFYNPLCKHYYEFSASTLGREVEYFVFIYVSIQNGEKLIEKYKL